MKQFPVWGKSVPKTAADRIAQGYRSFVEQPRIKRYERATGELRVLHREHAVMSGDEQLNPRPNILSLQRSLEHRHEDIVSGIAATWKIRREHSEDLLIVAGLFTARFGLRPGPLSRIPDLLAEPVVVCARLSNEPIELRIFPSITIKRRAVDKSQRPIYRAPADRPAVYNLVDRRAAAL
jgi:hypothetical protein